MHDRAGVLDLPDLERVLVRHEALRATSEPFALCSPIVSKLSLTIIGMQCSGPVDAALLEALIHRVGLLQRIRVGHDDGVDGRAVLVERVDALEIVLDEAAAREPSRLHRRMDLRDGGFVDLKRRRRLCRRNRNRDEDENGNEPLQHGGNHTMPHHACRLTFVLLLGTAAAVAQDALPVFEPMQPDVMGAGANFTNAFADYDNDGDLDLFVGFDGKPNRLYRNDKGVFADVASAAGVADARPTRAAAWGDFDADGDPDLLLGFTPAQGASVLKVYRNNGGAFVDATAEAGLMVPAGAVRQPAWIDFDADGDLDLFIAYRDRANAMYRNDNGKFADVAAADRTRRQAAHRRRRVVRLRRRRRSRCGGRQHGRRRERIVPQRRRQVHRCRRGCRRRLGRARARSSRRTAP